MAIEDAWVLARCIADVHATDEAMNVALSRYEAARRPRAQAVLAASRANGAFYHMRGLPARARNMTLRLTPASRLMSRYDWLYGWRP